MKGSMPKVPALGKGEIWTRKKVKAVDGKRCKVGWSDSEAEVGELNWNEDEEEMYLKGIEIDYPSQIIKIY